MTIMDKQIIGNESITVEAQKNAGNFLGTTKDYSMSSGGAFDIMNSLKKISQIFQWPFIEAQSMGFVIGASVPNFIRASITLIETADKIRNTTKEQISQHSFCEWTHDVLDFSAATAYFMAFFKQHPVGILKVATVFGLASDTTEVFSMGTQIRDHNKRMVTAQSIRPIVKRALQNDVQYSWLKIAKAVTAIVAGIFAVSLLFFGFAMVSMQVAVSVALLSSILNIAAYYQKNCIHDTSLKITFQTA